MCPEMAAMHGSVDMLDDDTSIFEEEHEFESFAQEFIEQNNRQDATDKFDFENENQELPTVNIMNITGIMSNDESIGTIP